MRRSGNLYRAFEVVRTMALFAGVVFAITWLGSHLEQEYSGYARIIDGDTLIIGEDKVRLTGIDAVELQQTCQSGSTTINCGYQSKTQLEKLIDNRQINCLALRRDRYYRLLAQCFLGKTDINRQMVLNGWAISWGQKYQDEEGIAKIENKGLWKSKFIRPSKWRELNNPELAQYQRPWWQIW